MTGKATSNPVKIYMALLIVNKYILNGAEMSYTLTTFLVFRTPNSNAIFNLIRVSWYYFDELVPPDIVIFAI